MKIILSPSKTASYQTHPMLDITPLLYPKQTKKLVAVIRKLSQKGLSKALQIQGDLLKETYTQYQNFHKSESFPAFSSFNGLVFKQLQVDHYNKTELDYITSHVRILDALYGLLEPTTGIKPYRLDMKSKIGMNLYTFWNVTPYFENELIVNLASAEFSSMINAQVITIQFLQHKDGHYINQATYAKMARGQILDIMIANQYKTIKEITSIQFDGYQFNSILSDDQTITFTREKKH